MLLASHSQATAIEMNALNPSTTSDANGNFTIPPLFETGLWIDLAQVV